MILYVLAGLFVVAAILMLYGAWLAAAAVLFGTGIVGLACYQYETDRRDAEQRNHGR
jgi:CHASE2 domain-containing sensor protein